MHLPSYYGQYYAGVVGSGLLQIHEIHENFGPSINPIYSISNCYYTVCNAILYQ